MADKKYVLCLTPSQNELHAENVTFYDVVIKS